MSEKNVGNTGIEGFYVNWKLSCRHRNVLKSTKKVKALSRLAGSNPRGCNVGINNRMKPWRLLRLCLLVEEE